MAAYKSSDLHPFMSEASPTITPAPTATTATTSTSTASPAPSASTAKAATPAGEPALIPIPRAPNGVIQIEDDIDERIARLFFNDELLTKIDQIPIEMRPKTTARSTRCCLYRDRALIRYRIMASLGLRLEDEDVSPEGETRTLASYAAEALARTKDQITRPILTILSEACNRCTSAQFLVTDQCQNCVARPCELSCPKGAIDHHSGRARIDPETCIRCGNCARACPFSAIIERPVPCINVCPVGAITQLPDGQKKFDFDICIQCGACQRACPFGAVMPRSHILDVLKCIKEPGKNNVVALIAPAIAGHFGPPLQPPAVVAALKAVGFTHVLEVALGADRTAILEAEEFQERMHEHHEEKKPGSLPFMTTSCCPAYVSCIRKHVPEIESAISNTKTPMHYTAEIARERWPGCYTVFIGPCESKLGEAIESPIVDFAITFHELGAILRARDIRLNIPEANATPVASDSGETTGSAEGRGFPIIGGVTAAVVAFAAGEQRKIDEEAAKAKAEGTEPPAHNKIYGVESVVIDGLCQSTVKRLRGFAKKPPPGNLVEVMACQGGCVAGPGAAVPVVTSRGRVKLITRKTPTHPDAVANPPMAKATIYRGTEVISPDD